VEAMARALPCIGSKVGGIPELLDEEDLVPVGDAEALAAKFAEALGSADRMEAMSRRSLERAGEFQESRLRALRRQFLCAVRESAAAWQNPNAAVRVFA